MLVKVTRPDGDLVWKTRVKNTQEEFHATVDHLGRLYLPNADGPIVPPWRLEVEDEEEYQ